jgi:hypothetical protein
MSTRSALLAFLVTALALTACQTNHEDMSTGSAAKSTTIIAAPTTDSFKDQQAEKRAYSAPIGQQLTWNNPANGDSGTITPVHDNYDSSGAYCRAFQRTSTIEGKQQESLTKACQQADGSWKSAP